MSEWVPSEQALRRQRYRLAQRRRSFGVALASTTLLAGIAVLVVMTSPGFERTRRAFFDPDRFLETLPAVASGLRLNLTVWLIAGVISLTAGLGLAMIRTSRAPALVPLRAAVTVYVDIFRGLPLLLVLLLVGFGLPSLRLPWLPIDGAILGALAIILTYTAYSCEIFRSGLEAVHPAQIAAARSLGLTRAQTTRRVVIPQGVRHVVPAQLNTVVSLQKDSGLISILGAVDAIRAAQIAVTGDYNFTPYLAAGFCFLLISIPLTRAVDAVNARYGWRGARATLAGAGQIR